MVSIRVWPHVIRLVVNRREIVDFHLCNAGPSPLESQFVVPCVCAGEIEVIRLPVRFGATDKARTNGDNGARRVSQLRG